MTEDTKIVIVIMTTVALMIIAATVMGGPAHGARGCLDRTEAVRTWPTKQLAIDDDGCFTYMRRGVKPVPVPPTPVLIPAPSHEEPEIIMGLDMLERWPTIIHHEPKARVVEAKPLLTPRAVVTVIVVVALTCAVFEVAFGGMTGRKSPKSGPN